MRTGRDPETNKAEQETNEGKPGPGNKYPSKRNPESRTPVASKTTNMHANAAMDMEKLFGVYWGVIFQNLYPGASGWNNTAGR